MAKQIPTRAEDYAQWYVELVKRADLAENSDVRGCMIIKPYGYAIWEKMQQGLDKMFKDTGHVNAYFPLFVPKSLFEAEEKNAEGFAKECAIVTHYRLKSDPNNKGKLIVDPDAKLEEELVVRPTSEAIIWSTYKKWIQSYRDLPILINQCANLGGIMSPSSSECAIIRPPIRRVLTPQEVPHTYSSFPSLLEYCTLKAFAKF